VGGLFLIYQSVHEIHLKMKGGKVEDQPRNQASGWTSMLLQMSLINIIFSLDSVITAVGMADHLWVMITAVVVSMLVMLLAATTIADFVNGNPSVKILALAFLVLIGVSLLAEGLEQEINKGYIYFSMAFAFTIEMINLRVDKFNSN
jgi:predicted tellurium resistance membrane protein TerC